MRWLEYGQRLRTGKRGALRGGEWDVAPTLLAAATAGGARALGLSAGRIEAGHWADLALIDLDHPSLAGCEAEHLGGGARHWSHQGIVRGTYVGGHRREGSQI